MSEILTLDLGMKHVMENFVLWLLLLEQKEHRAAIANDLIQTATNEPDFLKKVITEDELWAYGYDPKTRAPLSQWKLPASPCLKKAQQSHKIETILTVVFDQKGVVHHEYDPPGQTTNKEYYLNVHHWLRDAIRQKWLQLWATSDWQLHHHNTPTNTSCLVQFFSKILNHPGGSAPQ